MNVVLWVLQIVLALMFALAGVIKATQPKLVDKLPWVEDYSAGTVRFIGAVELLGALGLVLPAAFDVVPVLTPLAATGLATLMVLAMKAHRHRREPGAIVFTGLLFLATAVVAVCRFGRYSF
jgi:uncharacterized membrane protein